MKNNVTRFGWANLLRALRSVTLAAAAAFLATPVIAQNIEDIGGSQRIDFSGKLRMLSQRIPAAACYTQLGIDTDNSSAVLNAAIEEFKLITAALEFGNPDLGIIGVEERRKTQVGIGKLNELFAPIADRASIVAAGSGDLEAITAIADQSAPLLDMAKVMVTVIVGQYAQPAAVLQSDAMLIDIAGRQRMLAQRMSKNVCLITAGINVDVATAELDATRQVFDASLTALRLGMADAGIMPPPNEEIGSQLEKVFATWTDVLAIVDSALSGQTLDPEQLSIMFNKSNALTGEMNTAVGQYSMASKLGL